MKRRAVSATAELLVGFARIQRDAYTRWKQCQFRYRGS